MPDKFPATAIYALTPQGFALAGRIAAATGGTVFASRSCGQKEFEEPLQDGEPQTVLFAVPCSTETCHAELQPGQKAVQGTAVFFDSLKQCVSKTFADYPCHIFIAATGIVVRSLCPLLQGKQHDPAVLVIDQKGQFVISLISGHLGGANGYASRLAEILGATPVITTATDVEGLPAFDILAQKRNLMIGNIEAVRQCSSALLRGENVCVDDPANILGLAGDPARPPQLVFPPDTRDCTARVCVGITPLPPSKHCLCLYPRVIFAGVGCKRGTAKEDITEAVRGVLARCRMSEHALAGLCTFSAKADEQGLLEAADDFGVPVYCFSREQLALFPQKNISPHAMKIFGVAGVCEAAAQAGAHLPADVWNASETTKQTGTIPPACDFLSYHPGSLIAEKHVMGQVTVAVALHTRYMALLPEKSKE